MTDKLVAFLRDALDADEAVALRADPGPWKRDYHGAFMHNIEAANGRSISHGGLIDSHNVRHIMRHDPARVLREIAAKRRMIEALAEADPHAGYITATYTARDALRDMAAVYAGRDGHEEAIKS
jgi:hypothetical protein